MYTVVICIHSYIHSGEFRPAAYWELQNPPFFSFFPSFPPFLPLSILPSFHKYLLSIYYKPSTILGTWDILVNWTNKCYPLIEHMDPMLYCLAGDTDDKQIQ